jgi:hypothetical protein
MVVIHRGRTRRAIEKLIRLEEAEQARIAREAEEAEQARIAEEARKEKEEEEEAKRRSAYSQARWQQRQMAEEARNAATYAIFNKVVANTPALRKPGLTASKRTNMTLKAMKAYAKKVGKNFVKGRNERALVFAEKRRRERLHDEARAAYVRAYRLAHQMNTRRKMARANTIAAKEKVNVAAATAAAAANTAARSRSAANNAAGRAALARAALAAAEKYTATVRAAAAARKNAETARRAAFPVMPPIESIGAPSPTAPAYEPPIESLEDAPLPSAPPAHTLPGTANSVEQDPIAAGGTRKTRKRR